MSCQVKHWNYINVKSEPVKLKYVETKPKIQPMQWLRWFFTKRVARPVEVWEEAFPWP